MASGEYQHSAHLPCTVGCPPIPPIRSSWRLPVCRGKSFLAGLLCSFSLPSRGFIASGRDKRRQWLVEAATVPKIPLSGSRRSDEYHTRQRQNECAVFFYNSVKGGKKDVSTPQLSLLLIQGKDQRIDNSIKFMFIERAPRGSPQPIADRIQS